MRKYILRVDYIIARDGDRHYISASRLVELYRLNHNECLLLIDDTGGKIDSIHQPLGADASRFITLMPRPEGDYGTHLKDVLRWQADREQSES